MMKVEHTKGPWSVAQLEKQSIDVIAAGLHIARIDLEAHYAECGEPGDRPDAESRANARLIAAAPDLLAALENLADYMIDHGMEHDAGTKAALSAIAKAKGGAA